MNEYKKFLEKNYNMNSKITLVQFLECMGANVIDIYSIDAETNEEYFGTLGKEDVNNLTDTQKAYKVIRINNNSNNIIIYEN